MQNDSYNQMGKEMNLTKLYEVKKNKSSTTTHAVLSSAPQNQLSKVLIRVRVMSKSIRRSSLHEKRIRKSDAKQGLACK
ncbi:hypothetical protein CEXT_793481 [Caerostris extrusa]|uniref:Uncharacterized protein n=1 Tax=Caerostris extrusa TaxID=172846 RepID=A0AAV4SPY0_CAEEX|nr:hypothetical protein CEXT_793481 [Caerostris extrusa]